MYEEFLDCVPNLLKITEETAELTDAIVAKDKAAIQEELGDLLFSVVNLARFVDVSSEDALNYTTNKFGRRFRSIEASIRERGEQMQDVPLEELDRLWNEVKAGE